MNYSAIKQSFTSMTKGGKFIDLFRLNSPDVDTRVFGMPFQAYINMVMQMNNVASEMVALKAADKSDKVADAADTTTVKPDTKVEVVKGGCCLPWGDLHEFYQLTEAEFKKLFDKYAAAQKEAAAFAAKNKTFADDGYFPKDLMQEKYGTEEKYELAWKFSNVYRNNRHSTKENLVRYYDPKNTDDVLTFLELVDFFFLLRL